tara:strand:- start:1584 stop:1871 length:288 start_codon:yes stop_codon:yes gene_type:complete
MPVWVGRKIIGRIEGDTFYKPVRASLHKLRSPEAWAIDASVFARHIKDLSSIVIEDKETGNTYQADVALFNEKKGTIDRGHGRQYFLTMNYWTDI